MKKIKLHLGCGKKFIPGFTHVDIQDFPHIDIQTTVDKLDMIQDKSVDLIYACHLLEHFPRNKTEDVLKEWYRVLKKGGILRLAVPDFEKACLVYSKYKDIEKVKWLMGGQRNEYDFHYNIFDEKSLEIYLRNVGFKDIHRWDWKKTEHTNTDDYSQAYIPHMDKENGVLISLNIEGVK